MNTTLEHPDARVLIEEGNDGSRQIRVEITNPAVVSPRRRWTTRYPLALIEAVLAVKGPAYLCDEIARDEDPDYVASDLETSVFGYVPRADFVGKRVLDFGCGAGASTMVMARALPGCRIYAVELLPRLLDLARLRAAHYRLDNLDLLASPAPERLPAQIPEVDFVLLSAVYEHLLPAERPGLLRQMWQRLRPGGVLFINQTPDRRFPLETHTTGLPLINYLPDAAVGPLARRYSRRGLAGADWETLLRKGIRGATPAGIMHLLATPGFVPTLLTPELPGVRRQSDIWYRAARARLAARHPGPAGRVILGLMRVIPRAGVPVAPYLSLAIRKCARPDHA